MSLKFLAATFGAKKSSGWAVVPFFVVHNVTVTILAGSLTGMTDIPLSADAVSILDPLGNGLTDLIVFVQMRVFPNGQLPTSTSAEFIFGPNLRIHAFQSSTMLGDQTAKYDVLVFPGNLEALING